ncbi:MULTISPECIES: hypothetical protein [unclassified Cetobacterium]|uniref:hypothetical protein n=1 Tax=unclassified Cetobacterium TaxID=2630983 RepID=UPI00064665EC|nr:MULTISPECIES: hypothetical protein [unclassified Cetobacterium]
MKQDERIELQTLREKQKNGKLTRIELARFKVLRIYEELEGAKENELKVFNKEVIKIWNKNLKPLFMNEKLIELLKQDDNMKLLVDCVENGIREIKELNGIKAENENQGEIKNE